MYYREDTTIGHLAIALLSLNSRKLKSKSQAEEHELALFLHLQNIWPSAFVFNWFFRSAIRVLFSLKFDGWMESMIVLWLLKGLGQREVDCRLRQR